MGFEVVTAYMSDHPALFAVYVAATALVLLCVCCCYWRCIRVPDSGNITKTCGTVLASPYLTQSALELAEAVRSGKVTVTELVQVFIAQIKRVNPSINAVVANRFKEALLEAKYADERYATVKRANKLDTLPPLFGVPCTIKECFAVDGMPNSAGTWSRRKLRASSDALVVQRLNSAGAIVLGVTNLSELCMW
jgi:fatty acid amide hydrolase 2